MRRRHGLLALAGLLAGAGFLLVLLAPRIIDRRPMDPAAPWEPISLELSRPVDPESIAGRFSLVPAVDGQLQVDGRRVTFQPDRPWSYNQRYTVTLAAGVLGQNRLPLLRGARWSFELAPPRLLYLQEQDGLVDLWRLTPDGRPERLTREAAGVWDYGPLADGRGLVYSALDPADETLDLFLLNHDGDARLLLDCVDALCRSPAPQPGGRLVAYERQPLGAGLQAGELWLLDLDSGQTSPPPVPQELAAAGFEAPLGRYPVWSPDGRRLAFYRSDASLVVILDFGQQPPTQALTIPANLEAMAGWSPDGQTLAYTELAFGERQPHEHEDEAGNVFSHTRPSLYQHVILVDADGRQTEDLSAGLEIDEGRPAWHPSGEMLAVPRTSTGTGKQLFLVPLDGGPATRLTDDPFSNHSALAWSPDGRYLAFMRLPRADGASNPTLMLYDRQSGAISPIAEGAFLPGWWP